MFVGCDPRHGKNHTSLAKRYRKVELGRVYLFNTNLRRGADYISS